DLDIEQKYAEWSISKDEHEIMFEMLFINFFRYSFITTLYLFVENRLRDFCQELKNSNSDFPEPPKTQNQIIKSYRQYLRDEINIDSKFWNKIIELSKIRNCIVHRSGRVNQNEKSFINLCENTAGLVISSPDRPFPEDIQPLYLEDGVIILESKYCKDTVQIVRKFFQELFENDLLPKLIIGHD
ncbi:MAG: hypothetical protein IMZ60_04160, partial [Actinobacteria bacterium]|nr:hypothetical protein [Actinomycetota bacterium]